MRNEKGIVFQAKTEKKQKGDSWPLLGAFLIPPVLQVVLIAIAIMFVAVPEILVAFGATIIIMAGIGALAIGHRMRKSAIEFRDTDAPFFDDDFFGPRIFRRPVFSRFHRGYWQSLTDTGIERSRVC